VTHVYGLTKFYGPVTVCAWHEEWNACHWRSAPRLKSRRVLRYPSGGRHGGLILRPLEPGAAAMARPRRKIFMRGTRLNERASENLKQRRTFAGGLGFIPATSGLQPQNAMWKSPTV